VVGLGLVGMLSVGLAVQVVVVEAKAISLAV
jgi:hypothetical protein